MATAPGTQQQRVVLRKISWETYERLLAESANSSSSRFTYNRGALEIVSLCPGARGITALSNCW